MPNSSPQERRKRRDDRIDWEELEHAPNVDGMLSYLKRPEGGGSVSATQAVPEGGVAEKVKEPAENINHPSDTLPSISHPKLTTTSAQPIASSDLPLPKFTRTTDFPGVGKRRLHRCVLVQDAHSPGEQVLLNTLYRMAKNPRWGRAESEGSFLVSAPLTEIAEQTCMHETNVRANLRTLVDKLAIEIVAAENRRQQSARVYRIFSFKQILERRRSSGLEWVVKNRGVRFVSRERAEEILASDSLAADFEYESEVIASTSLPMRGSESLETRPSGIQPVVIRSTTIETKIDNSSTSHPPVTLVQGLHELLPVFDEQALESLWYECQIRAPSCTAEEVLYFAREKASICRNGKIQNPVGFLLTAVPKCFEGQSFVNFRHEQQKRTEAQRKLEKEQQETLRLQAEEASLEAEAYRRAEEKLKVMPNEDYDARCSKVRAELIRDHPQLKRWEKDQLEQTVRRKILREFQEKEQRELTNSGDVTFARLLTANR